MFFFFLVDMSNVAMCKYVSTRFTNSMRINAMIEYRHARTSRKTKLAAQIATTFDCGVNWHHTLDDAFSQFKGSLLNTSADTDQVEFTSTLSARAIADIEIKFFDVRESNLEIYNSIQK